MPTTATSSNTDTQQSQASRLDTFLADADKVLTDTDDTPRPNGRPGWLAGAEDGHLLALRARVKRMLVEGTAVTLELDTLKLYTESEEEDKHLSSQTESVAEKMAKLQARKELADRRVKERALNVVDF